VCGSISQLFVCLLQVTEGKIKGQIEVTRRRGRRRKKLLDDLKGSKGYCQLKEEALDRIMWRNRSGRGFGPVVWQITDDDDDDDDDNKQFKKCSKSLHPVNVKIWPGSRTTPQRKELTWTVRIQSVPRSKHSPSRLFKKPNR